MVRYVRIISILFWVFHLVFYIFFLIGLYFAWKIRKMNANTEATPPNDQEDD